MKRDIKEFVSLCDTCQRVIGMDFIVRLPRTQAGYDSIWVIVDRLTNVAHFIPVKTTYSGAKLTELYMS
jgi:hypothetical protein